MSEILSAVPVIISLVIIEGLLSVDNALAIAAIASELPGNQKIKALRYGILGAYTFRGLCMMFAAWIVNNPWIKAIGAAYLIYLMISQLWIKSDKTTEGQQAGKWSVPRGFWMTVVIIEFMDLSLSLDNVVAAVALDRRIWVVCSGVFIGIAIMRFVAGFCIRLIEKHPVLKTTAFLLVGFIGLLLLTELALEYFADGARIPAGVKFGGIFTIVAVSLFYEQLARLKPPA